MLLVYSHVQQRTRVFRGGTRVPLLPNSLILEHAAQLLQLFVRQTCSADADGKRISCERGRHWTKLPVRPCAFRVSRPAGA